MSDENNEIQATGELWGYGSGLVGCLFDNGPEYAESKQAAIDSVVFIFSEEMTKQERISAEKDLRDEGIHYFRGHDLRQRMGADYMSVWLETGDIEEDETLPAIQVNTDVLQASKVAFDRCSECGGPKNTMDTQGNFICPTHRYESASPTQRPPSLQNCDCERRLGPGLHETWCR